MLGYQELLLTDPDAVFARARPAQFNRLMHHLVIEVG